jgi:colanic acid/amylovoran biosynthesis protein
MTRILITNFYSTRNRGDAAIALGMMRDLRARPTFREAEIVVSSSDPDFDSEHLPVPVIPSLRALGARVAREPPLPELVFVLAVLPACLAWVLAYRVAGADLWLPPELRRVLRAYRDADLIVAAGGGYLYTTSPFKGNGVLLATVLGFLLGRLVGRPVVLYSQSIGPFASRLQTWLVRHALRCVQLIQVRERRSLALLEGWSLGTPIVLTADAAFLIEAETPPGLEPCAVGAVRVGLTVRRWFRREAAQLRYEGVLAAFVDWLITEEKAEVVFVPQVTHAQADDDDRTVARRIVDRLRHPGGAQVLEAELRPGEVKGLCGRMTYFVGTRMHSNIFALSLGVPVLAIGCQPKMSGLMEQLGLLEWTVPIDSLEPHVLQDAYRRLVARGLEVKRRLASAIPEATRSAMCNGQVIEEHYLRWTARNGGGGKRESSSE